MSCYKGCQLTIEIPKTGNYDQAAIKKALTDELPGIEITIQTGPVLHAANAVVPKDHSLAGMSEREVGSTQDVPTGARTLAQMADEVLGRFKPSSTAKRR
jgi:hypothetical protein